MSQFHVFLSHSSTDRAWAAALKTDLHGYGVLAWLDEDEIRPGDLIVSALEIALDHSQAVALIVSPAALESGWVREEYARALALAQSKQYPLQLIPVILKGIELPGFLASRKWVDFRDETAYNHNVWRLVWGITGQKPPEILDLAKRHPPIVYQPPLNDDPSPSSTTSIESPYGTMRPDSEFYVERGIDSICMTALRRPQAVTLFIKAPRQMGKSSLLRRILHRADQEHGRKSAFIDFQEFPKQHFTDEKNFLIEFCLLISYELGIPPAIESYWQGPQADSIKCRFYISQYIIPQVNGSFTLALDELDRLQASSFRDNFFGMLRTWHNSRARDSNLAKLTLLLSCSTESEFLLESPRQHSPFNVAEPISLPDFTRAEVEKLNERHGFLLTPGQVDTLMDLIAGHPFLTRLAYYHLATGTMDWDTLLARATDDTGPFSDHLRYYHLRVLDKPELKQALIDICRHQAYEENHVFHRLQGAGLIKRVGQQIVLRNNLYARYFQQRLGVNSGGFATVQTILSSKLKARQYDVFLCHNSRDKAAVKQIGEQLVAQGIWPWLDEWELPPGVPWQEALTKQIQKIKAVAVFIGPAGLGPWQDLEQMAFIQRFVARKSPVIPVILPGRKRKPRLPPLLSLFHCVDFRRNDPDPLEQLIWGITGKR